MNINIDELIEKLPPCIKRGPYIQYRKFPETVKQVLTILPNASYNQIKKIFEKTGFKVNTMCDWKKRLLIDPNYSPLDKQIRLKARIFTEEEEDSLAEYIVTQFLRNGKIFTDRDFAELAIDAYLQKHFNDPEDEDNVIEFQASKGFIYDFKQRHGFVSRKCHTKRRPNSSLDDEFVKKFTEDMLELFDKVDLDHILNLDETSWTLTPKQLKVWHEKGADHVARYVNMNDKENISVLACISASGRKFPLQFIAKGLTNLVTTTQIGNVADHMKAFSEGGFSTTETIYMYLNKIKEMYGDDERPIHLILDLYSSHRTDEIRQAADDLGIILHFIPAGLTDVLQPLDKKIFGMLKAYVRNISRVYFKDDKKLTKKDACAAMVRVWERLESYDIQDSFGHLQDPDSWDIKESDDDIIQHTCAYNRAGLKKQKEMMLNYLDSKAKIDERNSEGTSIYKVIMDLFGVYYKYLKSELIQTIKLKHDFNPKRGSVNTLITNAITKLIDKNILKRIPSNRGLYIVSALLIV